MSKYWLPVTSFLIPFVALLVLPTTVSADGARTSDRDSLNLTPIEQGLPQSIVHVADDLPRVIWVDLEQGQMYLLDRLGNDFVQPEAIPISLGKMGFGKRVEGDLRTPIGVYHVTSYLPDRKLDAKYGDGAFPVNYPGPYDRLQGRTGSGIWLHGLPKGVASRPLLDSDGCVVVDNPTLNLLKPMIVPTETVVVLAGELKWSERPDPKTAQFLPTFWQWHSDWESLNAEDYLQHYAQNFSDFRRDLPAWRKYKSRVNGNKGWIKVAVEKLSAIVHPDDPDLVVVRYKQNYRSSNYNWRGWKQMLWRRQDNGQWQIEYEGN